MNTYIVERQIHVTTNNRTATKFHLYRVSPDGAKTLLRRYIRLWEADNARDLLRARNI